jgi:hypothetical protein
LKSLFKTIFCLLILFAVSPSYAEPKRSYLSPDKKLKAVVVAAGNNCKEDKVAIYQRAKLLASEDNFSADCEHGQVVEYAGWTKDSRFFVFSMYSSGGHQSWASNVSFFDRKSSSILHFDKYLPPIADTKYYLKAPDYITLNIWTPFRPGEGVEESIILPITFKLSDIVDGGEKIKHEP